MSAEHVVWRHEQMLEWGAEGLAIDSHIAECDPFEDEVAMLVAFPHVAGDGGAVFPRSLGYPLDGILVGAVERIRNKALGHEIGVDAAGNGGGVPMVLVLELPVGEFENIHFTVAAHKEQQRQQEGNKTFHKSGVVLSVGF